MKFSMRLLSCFVIVPFFLVSCGDKEEVKSPQESEQGISNSSDIPNNRIEISEQENSVSTDNSDPLNSGLAKKSNPVSISEPENDNSGSDQVETFSQLLGKAESEKQWPSIKSRQFTKVVQMMYPKIFWRRLNGIGWLPSRTIRNLNTI